MSEANFPESFPVPQQLQEPFSRLAGLVDRFVAARGFPYVQDRLDCPFDMEGGASHGQVHIAARQIIHRAKMAIVPEPGIHTSVAMFHSDACSIDAGNFPWTAALRPEEALLRYTCHPATHLSYNQNPDGSASDNLILHDYPESFPREWLHLYPAKDPDERLIRNAAERIASLTGHFERALAGVTDSPELSLASRYEAMRKVPQENRRDPAQWDPEYIAAYQARVRQPLPT